jgi:uncharacterized protein YggE
MKAVILAFTMAVLLFCPVQAQEARGYNEQHLITVNGEAVIYAIPDKVMLNFGIETWDYNIAVAKKKNNDIMKKAISAIKECGVPQKEIQTDYLSIEPHYKNDYQKKSFLGYFVRNSMAVTINDPAKVEELVERLLQAGIESIDGIDFQTTEFKKYREQARELALKAAREKAEKMAAVLGQGIGVPIQISEGYSGWSGWRPNRQAMTQNVIQEVSNGGGEIPGTIALGKISIRANVTVVFELKEK